MDQLKRLEKLLEHKIKHVDDHMNKVMRREIVYTNNEQETHLLLGKFMAFSEMLIAVIELQSNQK